MHYTTLENPAWHTTLTLGSCTMVLEVSISLYASFFPLAASMLQAYRLELLTA